MKILLINPITSNISLSSPDLGLGYLAGALKRENHQVDILATQHRHCLIRRHLVGQIELRIIQQVFVNLVCHFGFRLAFNAVL